MSNILPIIVSHENPTGVSTCALPSVSWGAIFAGALAAVSLSIILMVLGTGLGLATLSPWSPNSISAASFTFKAVVWLIIIQWISSSLGGYLAGRLRTRFANVHTDEVFFRDTAHGLLTWALATLFTATLLVSTTSHVIGGLTDVSTTVASSAVAAKAASPSTNSEGWGLMNPLTYYVDGLYRSSPPSTANTNDIKLETGHIFALGIKNGQLSPADHAYLSQAIATQTGVTETEATTRLDAAMAQAIADKEEVKIAADKARKIAATASIFIFLSLLVGAFSAGVSAALGGRLRDDDY